MSQGPMIYYGDLIRAFAQCKTEEEKEAVAKMLGFEKKSEDKDILTDKDIEESNEE